MQRVQTLSFKAPLDLTIAQTGREQLSPGDDAVLPVGECYQRAFALGDPAFAVGP